MLYTKYNIQHSHSESSQDLHDIFGHGSPGTQMFQFLLPPHSFWGQNDEHRILVQEVTDQNAAKFIVVPLFMLRPTFALGLVKLIHQLQTLLIGVATQLALQYALVEIESSNRIGGGMREAIE